ncbi:MAG TPA: glycine--tRNA ligase subunit beta [Stellaceae bacterium]|nr:glycine--tRNA ligase subunit beta [Stellaceae bacterium]
MTDFLLELFSEEIPARMQVRAAEDLKRLVTEALSAQEIAFEAAASNAGPRRLGLLICGLAATQADRVVETKGPRVGAPQQAIDGFLRSAGLESLSQCEERDTGKGVFYFAVKKVTGRSLDAVLAEIVPAVLDKFPWPKSQRWGSHAARWVRPLHSILALAAEGGKLRVVPISWKLDREGGGAVIQSGNLSYGHRFMAPGPIEITSITQYEGLLRERFVVADASERRTRIAEDSLRLAQAQGLKVKPDDALLDEVVGLAEWPIARMGHIEPEFMRLPPEVLTTSMREHQKYFACETADGQLAPFFIVVTNNDAKDGGKQIIAGNERVLRARLSDALFFWDLDRQTTLASRLPKLDQRLFHGKLGTMQEKVARMTALVPALAAFVPGADIERASRAVHLAKADLSSAVVGEFPELQGIMGRYLALNDGEDAAVADAVAKHYAPVGASDDVPAEPVAIVAALADKLDTLAAFFAIDERPTGSKDPYALRRAALGVIRIVLENKLRLNLKPLFVQALNALAAAVPDLDIEKTAGLLLEFFADRLKVALRERGIRHDMISAVFALGGDDDLVRLVAKAEALQGFLADDDGVNLLTAYRRASRLVAAEEKKDGVGYRDAVETAALEQDEEKTLAERLSTVALACKPLIEREHYVAAMRELARLREPVDAFFDKVTVNAEQPLLRRNRLRLLARIWATLNQIADFSKIEG